LHQPKLTLVHEYVVKKCCKFTNIFRIIIIHIKELQQGEASEINLAQNKSVCFNATVNKQPTLYDIRKNFKNKKNTKLRFLPKISKLFSIDIFISECFQYKFVLIFIDSSTSFEKNQSK